MKLIYSLVNIISILLSVYYLYQENWWPFVVSLSISFYSFEYSDKDQNSPLYQLIILINAISYIIIIILCAYYFFRWLFF